MLIMTSTLYRDMLNFLYNQYNNIALLVFLTAAVNIVINNILSPGNEQLVFLGNIIENNAPKMTFQQIIEHMSVDQQKIFFKVSAAGVLASLIGNVLLAGSLITMIRLVSDYQLINIFRVISLSISILPRLLLLIFLMTLIIQLGLLLLIIPGILLTIAFSFAPVIISINDTGILQSIRLSAKLAYANILLVAPAILFWLSIKIFILLMVTYFTSISTLLSTILLTCLNNFISALLIIYFYRLYMLLNQKL